MRIVRLYVLLAIGLGMLLSRSASAGNPNCDRLVVDPFPTLQFGTMTTLDTKTLTLRLLHPSGFFDGQQQGDARLERFFFSKVGSVTLSDDSEVIRRKDEFYDLKVTVPAGLPAGPFGARIIIEGFKVNSGIIGERTQLCQVGVQAGIVEAATVNPASVDFGQLQQGTGKSVSLTVKAGTRLLLQEIQVTPTTHFSAGTLPTLEAGDTHELAVSVKPEAPAGQRTVGSLAVRWKTSTGQLVTKNVPLVVGGIRAVKPAADLTIEIVNPGATPPPPGGNKATVTLTLKISNAGTGSSAAGQATVSLDGNLEATVDVPAVPSQGNVSVDATFKTRKSGAHTLTAVADSGNTSAESNEANNTSAGVSVNIPG